jgi:hypothetical protein
MIVASSGQVTNSATTSLSGVVGYGHDVSGLHPLRLDQRAEQDHIPREQRSAPGGAKFWGSRSTRIYCASTTPAPG